MDLDEALMRMPLVAILRGVTPAEVCAVGEALFGAGICIMEIPLNSPEPLASIGALARLMKDRAIVGAGTVLDVEDVSRIGSVGGSIVVSPHTDVAIIGAARRYGLSPWPGVLSPSEAFRAVAAGARHLKLFPASSVGPAHLRALGSVLPKHVGIFPVGGVSPNDFGRWREAGAAGFGLGSELYRAGQSLDETHWRARAAVAAWRTA